MEKKILEAVEMIRKAHRVTAFTGAGISVESGIPPFRGPGGLWASYDPNCLDIRHFYSDPADAWVWIKEIFYEHFGKAVPNAAHIALADMEKKGFLSTIITQNIDNLHQEAGSSDVVEYHGNSKRLSCIGCGRKYNFHVDLFEKLPPTCTQCGSVLKPDFVFFGEAIPFEAQQRSIDETFLSDVWLVIGTTGEIFPASSLPVEARRNGKNIIEINIKPSNYSANITQIFLQGKATELASRLADAL